MLGFTSISSREVQGSGSIVIMVNFPDMEQVVGRAVNRSSGGEPGASPTPWTSQPKEEEEGGAVNRSSGGEPGASPTPWTPQPLPAGLLEDQVGGREEGWGGRGEREL